MDPTAASPGTPLGRGKGNGLLPSLSQGWESWWLLSQQATNSAKTSLPLLLTHSGYPRGFWIFPGGFPSLPSWDLSVQQGQVQLLGSPPEEHTHPELPQGLGEAEWWKKGKTRAGEGRAGRALPLRRLRGSRPVMLENSHPLLCFPETPTANAKTQMPKMGCF